MGTRDEEKRYEPRNLLANAWQLIRPDAVMATDDVFPLLIHLFGPFEACLHGKPLPRLRSRKGQWLLALLVLRSPASGYPREVERAWLAGTLWPDSSESAAFASLRISLKDLRHALGPEAGRLGSPTPRTLSLDLEGAHADVVAFDQAVARGGEAALERAVALYRGPLLEGCAEEWAFQERQIREQAYLAALDTLAAQSLARADPGTAERHLRRAVALEPLRETSQRGLMQALAAGGNYGAAIEVYRELRLRLHRELTVAPDPETQTLYQQIRAEARSKVTSATERLKDLARPEQVFQLLHPDLPAVFPPPRSHHPLRGRGGPAQRGGRTPGACTHNLPLQWTSFIGREQELAEAKQLLATTPLLTMTGPGGCGKTRLALQAAVEVLETYPDGVWLVELAGLSEPTLVPQMVAAALGVPEQPGRPLTSTLIEHLRSRSLLLVLDNCEHLLGACAQLVDSLLRACPDLRLLVTSRERLGLTGERVCLVPSLSLPPSGCGAREGGSDAETRTPSTEHLSTLLQSEAVRLFVERASYTQPQFALTEQNAGAVSQLCQRLDGIPLALELAAARVKAMPVEQLAARMDDAFRLLTGGSRTALPRQQTLRALIDWSYDLLSEAEKTVLCCLSVFAVGWTLEAAEAVCGGDGIQEWQVLDRLASLVDKSLVIYEERGGEGRYRLLETVRQYARDRLVDRGEAATVRARHRGWFLALAERAEPELRRSDQLVWLDRLEVEHDNLRAALAWCASEENGAETGLRLAATLWPFWHIRGYCAEGRQWLEGALSCGAAVPPALRARAFAAAAHLAGLAGDQAARQSLAEEGLGLSRASEDEWLQAYLLFVLGMVTWERADLAQAAVLGEQSLALARKAADPWLLAEPLLLLGMVARERGDCERATLLLTESLSLLRQIGDRVGMTSRLLNLGVGAMRQGHLEAAAAYCHEGAALSRDLRDRRGMIWCLQGLAAVAATQGQAVQAARMIGAVDATLEVMGHSMPPRMSAMYECTIEAVRACVDEATYIGAWKAGRATPLEQFVVDTQE